MRITRHTDYALRVLIYLTVHPQRRVTISEVARAYGISRSHLMKVVHRLAQEGYIATVPGPGGGLTLARPATQINVGEVFRHMESDLALVECFDPRSNTCPIMGPCGAQGVLGRALGAFLTELDRHCVADLAGRPAQIRARFLEAGA